MYAHRALVAWSKADQACGKHIPRVGNYTSPDGNTIYPAWYKAVAACAKDTANSCEVVYEG